MTEPPALSGWDAKHLLPPMRSQNPSHNRCLFLMLWTADSQPAQRGVQRVVAHPAPETNPLREMPTRSAQSFHAVRAGSERKLHDAAAWRRIGLPYREVGETRDLQTKRSTKLLKSLALPRGIEPLFQP